MSDTDRPPAIDDLPELQIVPVQAPRVEPPPPPVDPVDPVAIQGVWAWRDRPKPSKPN